jgi:hypothetical protein
MKNDTVKKILPLVIVAIVAGGLGFWGGSAYSMSKTADAVGNPAQRGAGNFAGGTRSGRTGTGASAFGGALTGTILSKDATSLTVQNRAGGSSIVFLAPSTTVSKPTDVTVDSLNVGDNVVVMGKANADGSIMAASIQVRPAQPAGAASGTPSAASAPGEAPSQVPTSGAPSEGQMPAPTPGE